MGGGDSVGAKQNQPNWRHYQQVVTDPNSRQVPSVDPIGGVDFPAADYREPQWAASGYDSSRVSNFLGSTNPWINSQSPNSATFGNQPPPGSPGSQQGPTMLPTFFDAMGFPFALPVSAIDPGKPAPYGLAHATSLGPNSKT